LTYDDLRDYLGAPGARFAYVTRDERAYGVRMARIKGSREQVDRVIRRIQTCRELTTPGPVANSGGGGISCQSG